MTDLNIWKKCTLSWCIGPYIRPLQDKLWGIILKITGYPITLSYNIATEGVFCVWSLKYNDPGWQSFFQEQKPTDTHTHTHEEWRLVYIVTHYWNSEGRCLNGWVEDGEKIKKPIYHILRLHKTHVNLKPNKVIIYFLQRGSSL